MAKLPNGFYNQPTCEQQTESYQRSVMRAKSDLRTVCAVQLQQSNVEHEQAARDYHKLWLED